MTKFVYIGGKTPSNHVAFEWRDNRKEPLVVATDDFGNPIVDERDEHAPEAPESTTAFGLTFVKNRPREVLREHFKTAALYDHAMAKLRANRFFKELTSDAVIVEDTPSPMRRKPGPKPRPTVQVDDEDPSEVAA